MKFLKNNNKLKIRIVYKSILFSLTEHSKIMSPFYKKKIVEDAFLYKQWWTEQVTVQGKKNVDEWQRNAELGVQWGFFFFSFYSCDLKK
jgi:hypothetical protein